MAEDIAEPLFLVLGGISMDQNSHQARRAYIAIFSCALLAFIGVLNETSMNVTYPQLSNLFHVSLDVVQWITAGYLLMVTLIMGTTAFLLKRFNPRRLQLAAGLFFVIGALLCACAPNFSTLVVGRIIQALATGIAMPLMFQLVFSTVPKSKLGMMTGMSGMVIALAPALGPTYGGAVSEMLSWRLIFWLLIPFAIIALICGQLTINNRQPVKGEPFSWLAMIILAIALVSWTVAASAVGKPSTIGRAVVLILVGTIAFVCFAIVNQRGTGRMFDLGIFKQVTVVCGGFAYFSLQFINIGISMVIPVYAQEALGISTVVAGLILLPGSLFGAVFAPLGGHWADRTGYRYPVLTGACLLFIATLGFALGQKGLNAWTLTGWYILLRIGFNLSFASTLANTTTLVDESRSADVNSIFNMLQQFAGSLGVSLLAALLALAQLTHSGSLIERTIAGGQIDYWLLAFIAFLALLSLAIDYHLQYWGGFKMDRSKLSVK